MHCTRLILACSFALVLGLVASGQQNQKENDNQAKLAQLKRDRMATAERLWAATRSAFNAGVTTAPVLIAAAERRRDAELAAAENDDQRIKFLRDHLERVKKIRDDVKQLAEQLKEGGTADKEALSELAYQDAEIALLTAMNAKQNPK
jgi:hypothetical protein